MRGADGAALRAERARRRTHGKEAQGIEARSRAGSEAPGLGQGAKAAQAARCFQVVVEAVAALGGGAEDVTRTRVYLKRREDWKPVAAAHGKTSGTVRPATTFLVVDGFIGPA